MKAALPVVAVLLILVGLVWFFQGVGVIQGSVMTNQPIWSVIGAVLIIGGGALIAYTARLRRRAS